MKANQGFEFGKFRVDLAERALYTNGRMIPLTPKVFQTLLVLVERRGHVVQKEELRHAVWPDTFVEENNLNQNIRSLRKALGETETERYIETVPRRGYRLLASVRELESEPTPAAKPARHWKVVALAAGALLGTLPWWHVGSRPEIRSVAVLPIVNLSGDPQQDYIAEGLTEALITELARLSGLRVISRTSVMQYKEARKKLPEIARELRVDAVLEGAVVRTGDRLRISTQLIRAATDEHLWANTFDRDLTDVALIQDEVAQTVARQIRVSITPADEANRSVIH